MLSHDWMGTYIWLMSQDRPTPARRVTQARVFRLGEEPSDDLSATTTVEERLALVAELSRRMWELTGRPQPAYSRATMPIRVIRSA